jgi:hypothetical protein
MNGMPACRSIRADDAEKCCLQRPQQKLASLAGKDAVYAVGFGNKATVTSYGIRNPCVRQKVSGSETKFSGSRDYYGLPAMPGLQWEFKPVQADHCGREYEGLSFF